MIPDLGSLTLLLLLVNKVPSLDDSDEDVTGGVGDDGRDRAGPEYNEDSDIPVHCLHTAYLQTEHSNPEVNKLNLVLNEEELYNSNNDLFIRLIQHNQIIPTNNQC